MTVNDLEVLFDYSHWANRKLFETMSRLTPEQFTKTVDGSHGAIRSTMVHALSAEWGWLSRCDGPDRGAPLNPADYPTVESLVATWTKVEAYVREFLSRLRDEDLNRNVEFMIGGTEKRGPARTRAPAFPSDLLSFIGPQTRGWGRVARMN
jgi:uncharacterized damage-inducible protein DinB